MNGVQGLSELKFGFPGSVMLSLSLQLGAMEPGRKAAGLTRILLHWTLTQIGHQETSLKALSSQYPRFKVEGSFISHYLH